MDTLSAILQRVVRAGPCSQRALAKAAGVPWTTVSMVMQGKRRATPEVVAKVAAALEQWSATCAVAAKALRRATTKGGSHATR